MLFRNLFIIPLKPLSINEYYKSFEALKADMQQYAYEQKYAIITKCLKKNKKNKHIIKIILMCDQGQKQHINCATTYLNTISQNIECLFICYAVNKKCADSWILVVMNLNYNHFKSFHSSAHAIYYIADCNSF